MSAFGSSASSFGASGFGFSSNHSSGFTFKVRPDSSASANALPHLQLEGHINSDGDVHFRARKINKTGGASLNVYAETRAPVDLGKGLGFTSHWTSSWEETIRLAKDMRDCLRGATTTYTQNDQIITVKVRHERFGRIPELVFQLERDDPPRASTTPSTK